MRSLSLILALVLVPGCASAPDLPAIGSALEQTRAAYFSLAEAHDRICRPTPVLPQLAGRCIEIDRAMGEFAEHYNLLVDIYSAVNDQVSE